jgi:hypothetical protein
MMSAAMDTTVFQSLAKQKNGQTEADGVKALVVVSMMK